MDRYLNLIYLAAGLGSRFGSNKLLVPIQGQPLFRHGLDSLADYQRQHPDRCRIIVVTRFPEIIAAAQAIGATVVENDQPEAGIAHSIRLGLAAGAPSLAVTPLTPAALLAGPSDQRADQHADIGAVFLVADQPWLKKETLAAFLERARQTPAGILTAGHAGIPGNPVSFDQVYYPDLMQLEGDHGGRIVVIQHPETTEWYDIPAHEQIDIDHVNAIDSPERQVEP